MKTEKVFVGVQVVYFRGPNPELDAKLAKIARRKRF